MDETRAEHNAEELVRAEAQLDALSGRTSIGSLLQSESISGRELLGVLGGRRGLVETLLPGIVFVVVYAIGPLVGWSGQQALSLALSGSLGLSVVFVALRILQRSPIRAAVAGLVAAAASAALALMTGRPEDNYLLGIIINAGYGTALLISILVRWPLIGVFVGVLMGDGVAWRHNRRRFRVLTWLTVMWIGLFALRLLIELPLYLSSQVVALGIAKLILGTPLYAMFLVVTWLVTRAIFPSTREQPE
ncbi:MAG: DUF3159 domain-containing protein [Agromyces sp.]